MVIFKVIRPPNHANLKGISICGDFSKEIKFKNIWFSKSILLNLENPDN